MFHLPSHSIQSLLTVQLTHACVCIFIIPLYQLSLYSDILLALLPYIMNSTTLLPFLNGGVLFFNPQPLFCGLFMWKFFTLHYLHLSRSLYYYLTWHMTFVVHFINSTVTVCKKSLACYHTTILWLRP